MNELTISEIQIIPVNKILLFLLFFLDLKRDEKQRIKIDFSRSGEDVRNSNLLKLS